MFKLVRLLFKKGDRDGSEVGAGKPEAGKGSSRRTRATVAEHMPVVNIYKVELRGNGVLLSIKKFEPGCGGSLLSIRVPTRCT